jgi:hypothetical protein
MESGGKEGKINVSEVTKALLEQDQDCAYEFIENKKIKILGNEVNSFFIEPKQRKRLDDSAH